MPAITTAALNPRRSPVQARSTASVDAILEATVQVLLAVGKDRLTTTRVAARAGVSVGTLYQYFPNKSSLLQAALRRHLDTVAEAVDQVCHQQRHTSLANMAATLITAFLGAKLKHPKSSAAFYSISADLDGARISSELADRLTLNIADMLRTTTDPLTRDPELLAIMIQGVLTGTSRRLLESPDPATLAPTYRTELTLLVTAYLTAPPTLPTTSA